MLPRLVRPASDASTRVIPCPVQDRLHRALAESEDLAAAFRQELAGIEREARLL